MNNNLGKISAETLKVAHTEQESNRAIGKNGLDGFHEASAKQLLSLHFENWESRELCQTHMGNQHLKDYLAATDGLVDEFTLTELTKL